MDRGMRLSGITTGDYRVVITDSMQCVRAEVIHLDMTNRIPNTFTPNGDGIKVYTGSLSIIR